MSRPRPRQAWYAARLLRSALWKDEAGVCHHMLVLPHGSRQRAIERAADYAAYGVVALLPSPLSG